MINNRNGVRYGFVACIIATLALLAILAVLMCRWCSDSTVVHESNVELDMDGNEATNNRAMNTTNSAAAADSTTPMAAVTRRDETNATMPTRRPTDENHETDRGPTDRGHGTATATSTTTPDQRPETSTTSGERRPETDATNGASDIKATSSRPLTLGENDAASGGANATTESVNSDASTKPEHAESKSVDSSTSPAPEYVDKSATSATPVNAENKSAVSDTTSRDSGNASHDTTGFTSDAPTTTPRNVAQRSKRDTRNEDVLFHHYASGMSMPLLIKIAKNYNADYVSGEHIFSGPAKMQENLLGDLPDYWDGFGNYKDSLVTTHLSSAFIEYWRRRSDRYLTNYIGLTKLKFYPLSKVRIFVNKDFRTDLCVVSVMRLVDQRQFYFVHLNVRNLYKHYDTDEQTAEYTKVESFEAINTNLEFLKRHFPGEYLIVGNFGCHGHEGIFRNVLPNYLICDMTMMPTEFTDKVIASPDGLVVSPRLYDRVEYYTDFCMHQSASRLALVAHLFIRHPERGTFVSKNWRLGLWQEEILKSAPRYPNRVCLYGVDSSYIKEQFYKNKPRKPILEMIDFEPAKMYMKPEYLTERKDGLKVKFVDLDKEAAKASS